MTALFSILIVVISILLVLVILVQNPKGGGLSSAFGGDSPQMLGGVKKTTDFLDKATWGLVIGLFALVIAMNMSGGDVVEEEDTLLREQVEGAVPFQPAPVPVSTDVPAEDMPVEGLPESVEE
ncbi:preprotein translocase subunit SecG [Schleiferiaceae bacterium]|jgi:preprotein translocase subunit SecG|nr:preprotein translocase subunit SecG [Schleiferiaceae bacterium]